MTSRFVVAVDGVLAEVRILAANPVVGLDRAVGHRELDFGRVVEEREAQFRRHTGGVRGFCVR